MSQAVTPGLGTRLASASAATLLLWLGRTLLAFLIAYPVLVALRSSGISSGPKGDAVLFEPGALLLLEWLRVGTASLAAGLHLALVIAVLAALLELLPLAWALELLWLPGLHLSGRFTRAIAVFPRFLCLGGVTLLAQAALLLAGSLLGAALGSAVQGSSERVRDLVPLGAFGLGLVACVCFGAVLDVARAAVVQRGLGVRDALQCGLSCLLDEPSSVLLGMYPSVAGSALSVLCALWLVAQLDLSSPARLPIALGFVVQQLAVLFAIAWRVRWLGRALELSRSARLPITEESNGL